MNRKTNLALKAALGSPYWRDAQAEAVLSAWSASGGSLFRFARQHGVSVSRLYRWHRRLGGDSAVQFHPVELVRPPVGDLGVGGGVELVLRDGRRVALRRGFDPVLLEEVVRTAESWSC